MEASNAAAYNTATYADLNRSARDLNQQR